MSSAPASDRPPPGGRINLRRLPDGVLITVAVPGLLSVGPARRMLVVGAFLVALGCFLIAGPLGALFFGEGYPVSPDDMSLCCCVSPVAALLGPLFLLTGVLAATSRHEVTAAGGRLEVLTSNFLGRNQSEWTRDQIAAIRLKGHAERAAASNTPWWLALLFRYTAWTSLLIRTTAGKEVEALRTVAQKRST